jgi:hypothetical protein
MSHVTYEQLVDLWFGDAVDESELETHVFACDECGLQYAQLAELCTTLGGFIPPVISHAHRDRMVARGTRIHLTPVDAGVVADATFADELDLLIHALRGDFSRAERVDVAIVLPDGTERVLERVPFDAKNGEVLIACQRHYAQVYGTADPDFVLTVTEDGSTRTASYTVRHHWPAQESV